MDIPSGLHPSIYRFFISFCQLGFHCLGLHHFHWHSGRSYGPSMPNTLERLIGGIQDGWARTARRWLARWLLQHQLHARPKHRQSLPVLDAIASHSHQGMSISAIPTSGLTFLYPTLMILLHHHTHPTPAPAPVPASAPFHFSQHTRTVITGFQRPA